MDGYLSLKDVREVVVSLSDVGVRFSVNLNDMATVELTQDGKAVLRKSTRSYLIKKVNKDKGTLTIELWCLMSIFGDAIYMGGPQLFTNNLITIDKDL